MTVTLELADYLDPIEDERLAQAQALVRAFCGWHIAPSRTETVTLRGYGQRRIFLPSLYVTDVASVTVEGSAYTVDLDYTWTEQGVLRRLGGWWTADEDIVVEFTHGYAAPPAEVTGVVQAVALRLIGSPANIAQVGQVRYATADTIAATDAAALGPYRVIPVA